MRAPLSSPPSRPAGPPSRRPLWTAALAAVASLGLLTATASNASAAAPVGPYVALGDSFSAGSGILPLDLTANPLCARTTRNYPHLVAAAIDPESFTDATCGGADTGDFYSQQYIGAPAQ